MSPHTPRKIQISTRTFNADVHTYADYVSNTHRTSLILAARRGLDEVDSVIVVLG